MSSCTGSFVEDVIAFLATLIALLAPLQLLIGDLHGLNTARHQPAKVAAIEAHWDGSHPAPLVLFDGIAPGAALKASFSACLKNVIAFTLYAIVLVVLFIVATIPFGLGLIVVVPVALISVYTAYREIFFDA